MIADTSLALCDSLFAGILLVATPNQKLPSFPRVQFPWFLTGTPPSSWSRSLWCEEPTVRPVNPV